mgnify:CR=1 FL=1
MLALKKVAVTGGLSSGKSSVCRFFKELGAYVISADEIVHQLLTPQTPLGQQVVDLLGNDIIVDGKIDRSKTASKVFNNAKLLKGLEDLLHPAVRKKTQEEYQKALTKGDASLFVVEIPLLFETGNEKEYDATIAVISDPKASMERFYYSTGYGEDEYKRRMARQLSPEEKSKRAHFIIHNNGSLADLKNAVTNIYHQFNPSI